MSTAESQKPAGASIITQVQAGQQGGLLAPITQGLNFSDIIRLDLRGTIIELTRHELSQLPESILLGISNGILTDSAGDIMLSLGDVEAASVNFSPACLQYTLDVFRTAAKELPASPESPTAVHSELEEHIEGSEEENVAELLRTKPAIIVLREDLDYYCLPPRSDTSIDEMKAIKRECGKRLVGNTQIFTRLQRGDHSGPAEKHLVDMLCSSGFSLDEHWGFREMEPNKTVINSLALVRLVPIPDEPELERFEDASELPSLDANSLDAAIPAGPTPATSQPTSPSPVESKVETEPTESENSKLTESKSTTPPPVEVISASTPSSKEANIHDREEETNAKEPEEDKGVEHTEEEEEEYEEESDESEHDREIYVQSDENIPRSHKLLLFWRKPARKCWWDNMSLPDIPGVEEGVSITVYLRSVWTLELSVIDND